MELGVEAMLQMPERIHKTIAEQSSLVNMPRIGSHRNQYFNTIQVNLASASPKVASKFISLLLYTLSLILFFIALSENLGTHFGALHMDLDDALRALTQMLWCTDLPDKFHPGAFFFPEVQVYTILDGVTGAIGFSGQHYHGGTAPFPQDDGEMMPWAYRGTVVLYPGKKVFDGQVSYPISQLPKDHYLNFQPDMQLLE